MSQNDSTLYPVFSPMPCALNVSAPQYLSDGEELTVYPNPVYENLTVKWAGNLNMNVSIINPLGQIIKPWMNYTDNAVEISLADFAPGIYSLIIITDIKMFSRKIIKI
jgi:hypothetical protein